MAKHLFRVGQLFVRKKDKAFLRLTGVDLEANEAYFLTVSKDWSRTPKRCEALGIADVSDMVETLLLEPIDECIRPSFMLQTDEELAEQERKKALVSGGFVKKKDGELGLLEQRDKDLALIEPLVREDALVSTFNPRTAGFFIAKRAEEMGVPQQVIERLVYRYAWFGLSANALLPLHSKKGLRPGAQLLRSGKKRGRPSAVVVLGGANYLKGVNVTKRDIARFEKAIRVYHIRSDEDLKRTYDLMCANDYVATTEIAP